MAGKHEGPEGLGGGSGLHFVARRYSQSGGALEVVGVVGAEAVDARHGGVRACAAPRGA